MQFFNVGPCEFCDYDLKQIGEYKWLVYWYDYDCYEGNGIAVGLCADGSLDVYDLSHCSCYGPLERGCVNESVESFLREPDSVFDPDYNDEVLIKVRELTQ